MKNDLPYFTHDNDARNHAKMKALRARFGWAGYGQFWALNEMIAASPEARLDLSRKVVRASVACELGMATADLEALLAFLADPEECGLVRYVDGILTTDRTQEDFSRVESERTRKRGLGKTSAEKRESSAENSQSSAEPPRRNPTEQSRGEERREEQEPRAPEKPGEAEDLDFVAFGAYCLRLAEERKAKNPPAMARKLATQPDVIADFKALRGALASGGARPDTPCPPPPRCDCPEHGEIKADRVSGTGKCLSCGAWWSFGAEFGWSRELEAVATG